MRRAQKRTENGDADEREEDVFGCDAACARRKGNLRGFAGRGKLGGRRKMEEEGRTEKNVVRSPHVACASSRALRVSFGGGLLAWKACGQGTQGSHEFLLNFLIEISSYLLSLLCLICLFFLSSHPLFLSPSLLFSLSPPSFTFLLALVFSPLANVQLIQRRTFLASMGHCISTCIHAIEHARRVARS